MGLIKLTIGVVELSKRSSAKKKIKTTVFKFLLKVNVFVISILWESVPKKNILDNIPIPHTFPYSPTVVYSLFEI